MPDQCQKVKYDWCDVAICRAGLYKPWSMSAVTIIVLRFALSSKDGGAKDWDDCREVQKLPCAQQCATNPIMANKRPNAMLPHAHSIRDEDRVRL